MREEIENGRTDSQENEEDREGVENREDRVNKTETWQDGNPFDFPEGPEGREEMPPWQDDIMRNCRLWTEGLREMAGPAAEEEPEEAPDLYSFYEELCVLRNEFRKNARRSHEVFSQFGESLGGFQDVLGSLTQRQDVLSREQGSAEVLARQGHFLQIVELYERLRRFGEKLEETKAPRGPDAATSRTAFLDRIKARLGGKGKSPDAVRAGIIEGFSLIVSHFEGFLAGEGISRIETVGRPFDPSVMLAVGIVETNTSAPDTVDEEIEGGYVYGEYVLKLAKVTVAKEKGR